MLQQNGHTFVAYVPGPKNYASRSIQQAPGPFQQASGSFQQASGPFQQPSGPFQQASGPFQQASGPSQQSTILPGPGRMKWDAFADQFAMIGHNAGKDPPEIARQLIINGYSATRWDVAESLQRQGAQKVAKPSTEPSGPPKHRCWDIQADTLALSQHNAGQTAGQISAQLIRHGYATTRAEVAGNLHRLGVHQVHLGPIPVSAQRWDNRADTFAKDAFRHGQTVTQIMGQLTRNGYQTTETEVLASLQRQGLLAAH